ncbi:hypothetical protein CEK27_001640 [Fusarium fujikuroi]|nr:Uncharacterized protein Y057_298 [Fusarium fujikuroi]QGI59515.1 hypothetical protein CEK27_001640 [Fusarium fujikuroi]
MDHYHRLKLLRSCHRRPTHGGDKLCSSWVYSPESEVHIILKTKRSPSRRPSTRGEKNMGELVLKNVIYAPNYICNVIGGNIAQDGYAAKVDTGSFKCSGDIRDTTGCRVAHFRLNKNSMQQIEVRIWGPPSGRELKERSAFPTRIRLDLPYFKHDIWAKWPTDERCRFERYRLTRFPSVNIGKRPWSEEELQWLGNEGINFDEMVERTKIRHDEEHPADAGIKTRKVVTILRGKHRAQWLKNPFQEHFDLHTRSCKAYACDRAFSLAQNGFVYQVWDDAQQFMYMYGYEYEVNDDCGIAAIQVKDIMREQVLEVSNDEEWEDEDEDVCECEHDKCECVDGID